MDKSRFDPHSRYTVTLKTAGSSACPANFYVYRTLDQFMIVRFAADGKLHKLRYDAVLRIVASAPVQLESRYHVPAALLDEKVWEHRSTMDHYSSGPHSGK